MNELWVPGPDNLPTHQSEDLVEAIVRAARVGDVAHILPQGPKADFLMRHGLPQVHGVVDPFSQPGRLVLWSTYFAFNPEAFRSDEARTFSPADIRLIVVDRAEEYIPRASEGKFAKGGAARITVREGDFVVRVDSFFGGIVSGLTNTGERFTGVASFFTPVK